jgi:hypothetical protein
VNSDDSSCDSVLWAVRKLISWKYRPLVSLPTMDCASSDETRALAGPLMQVGGVTSTALRPTGGITGRMHHGI